MTIHQLSITSLLDQSKSIIHLLCDHTDGNEVDVDDNVLKLLLL